MIRIFILLFLPLATQAQLSPTQKTQVADMINTAIKPLKDTLAARVQKIDTSSGLRVVNNVLTINNWRLQSRIDSLIKVVAYERTRSIEYKRLLDIADTALSKRISAIDLTAINKAITQLQDQVLTLSADQTMNDGHIQELIMEMADVMDKIQKMKAALQ